MILPLRPAWFREFHIFFPSVHTPNSLAPIIFSVKSEDWSHRQVGSPDPCLAPSASPKQRKTFNITFNEDSLRTRMFKKSIHLPGCGTHFGLQTSDGTPCDFNLPIRQRFVAECLWPCSGNSSSPAHQRIYIRWDCPKKHMYCIS